MAILPISIGRVSDLLRTSVADSALNTTQAELLQVQNELSTGKQINQPSDDPAGAATILSLTKTLAQRQTYSDNINTAQSQLGVVDNTLTSTTNLLLQATQIAQQDVSTGNDSASQQQADAQVVNSLLSEAKSLANTQSDGVYLFGGSKSNAPPYVSTNGGIQFVGSPDVLQTQVDQGVLSSSSVSGQSVFGGLSEQVAGTALNPGVTSQTQLSTLGGADGTGVSPGSIQLGNGTATQTIDLSSAQTLGDVVSAINAAGAGSITASLTSSGIQLSGGSSDDITVSESGGGTTASDLGILTAPGGAGTGVSVTGAALNPAVTDFTPLSSLNGGAGLDSHGLIITNGGVSKTIVPTAGGDVQSLLNEINGAGLGVTAQINSSGTGIDVLNATQGTTLTIGENGGDTATELGIRSFSPSSDLSELNNGQGVGTAPAGSSGDFTITGVDGTSFNVSIAGATTVQNVLDDINSASTAAGSGVTASFATTGNGIVLTDSSTGSGTLTVTDINNSTAAADLGLTSPASATSSSITGSDVNGVQSNGLFSDLQALAAALQTGNAAAITAAGVNLQADYTNAGNIQAVAGAQSDELQTRSSQMTSENIATQTLLSNVQDTNMTTAISEFQTLQTALQASLLTTVQSQSLSLLDYLG